ncbi:hypothetical protein QO259_10005 [Salinicola sp. JS01]|uniref:hypothetical protein n=1 Tax=Salinicola sp. JS01 TaxID=3050071 RepID=UPI00255C0733|nr:hypothetical protein [Salinicola sp. JS01]WIX34945.1 hypothetical protein QO259_10005 [Salinicola sp. JS01]
MLSLLSRLGGLLAAVPFKAWLAAAIVVALAGGVWWHLHQVDGLRDDLADAKQAAKDAERDRDAWMNTAFQRTRELNLERQERAAGETATRALNAQLDTLDQRYLPLRERIELAPDTDDAPVAPVLRQAIEDLP